MTQEKKFTAVIANFTCTFLGSPLLENFESVVYPALNNYNLYKTSKSGTRYHITDLKLVKLDDGNIALVGKHVKRTILSVSQDYDKDSGFTGEEFKLPSAPYATFILLLNNHRVIYFKNKAGAPGIREFGTTCSTIINLSIKNKRNSVLDAFKKNNYMYNGEKYKTVRDFKKDKLLFDYPECQLNIIPVESKALVKKAFSTIDSISKVNFKFYKTNNEVSNFDFVFESNHALLDSTECKTVNQTIIAPQNFDAIESVIASSEGKADYTVNAKTISNEKLVLTAESVTEEVSITCDDENPIDVVSKNVYNQLNDREAVTNISKDNYTLFERFKSKLIALIK